MGLAREIVDYQLGVLSVYLSMHYLAFYPGRFLSGYEAMTSGDQREVYSGNGEHGCPEVLHCRGESGAILPQEISVGHRFSQLHASAWLQILLLPALIEGHF